MTTMNKTVGDRGTGESGEAAARIEATRSSDPGDQTERNFRYQHQYGVVLLVAVRRGSLGYISLYCEHHEDFLAERPDGLFDGYQVKTSKPENGAWTLTSTALVRSIGRFVDLLEAYPDQIGNFFFVSNSEADSVTGTSTDHVRRGRCPRLMLAHVRGRTQVDDIEEPFRTAFDKLAAELGATPARLLDVLKRLSFIKAPSREEFDASLAHEHLGTLAECAALTTSELTDLRDRLVSMFHKAASIHVTDPDRHVKDFLAGGGADPFLLSKRIVCADVVVAAPAIATKSVAYQGEPIISLNGSRPEGVLEQKLAQGGISDTVEYMKAREQAAEYHFLEEQAKNPRTAGHQLRQIEEAVHGECLEAYMRTKTEGQRFGQEMFNEVTVRLRKLEADRRELLGGQPYEVLMGTAALLTSECRVWWSERFPVVGGRT
ncbi:dsDNA nuclease domain-containing protein [Agrobacterium vitis]